MRSLLLVWLCACVPASDPPNDAPDTDRGTTLDSADPCRLLTWETVGAPFVTTWCTPCHGAALTGVQRSGAPVGIDLDREDQVLDLTERVLARTTGATPTMPPAGGPDADTRARFAAWLACERTEVQGTFAHSP